MRDVFFISCNMMYVVAGGSCCWTHKTRANTTHHNRNMFLQNLLQPIYLLGLRPNIFCYNAAAGACNRAAAWTSALEVLAFAASSFLRLDDASVNLAAGAKMFEWTPTSWSYIHLVLWNQNDTGILWLENMTWYWIRFGHIWPIDG